MQLLKDTKGTLRWPRKLSPEAKKFLRNSLQRTDWTTMPRMFSAMALKFGMSNKQKKDVFIPSVEQKWYFTEFRTLLSMEGYEPDDIYWVKGSLVQVYIKPHMRGKLEFKKYRKRGTPRWRDDTIAPHDDDGVPSTKLPPGRPPKDGIYRATAGTNYENFFRAAFNRDEESDI